MTTRSKILLLTLFGLIFHSCSLSVDPKQLIGDYYLNEGAGKDSIFIVKGNKYIHRYTTDEGKVFESTSNWKLNSGGNLILFEDFVFFTNDVGYNKRRGGNWFSRIRVSSKGQIDLIYSRENNIFYRKVLKKQGNN